VLGNSAPDELAHGDALGLRCALYLIAESSRRRSSNSVGILPAPVIEWGLCDHAALKHR
jgi:hypothetical protein